MYLLICIHARRQLWGDEATWGAAASAAAHNTGWQEGATPASKMLGLVTGLLQGELPSTQDALLVRTAILQAWDLYTPVGGWLEEAMAAQEMDVRADFSSYHVHTMFILCVFHTYHASYLAMAGGDGGCTGDGCESLLW